MSAIRIGPARVPSRESPEQAVALLRLSQIGQDHLAVDTGFFQLIRDFQSGRLSSAVGQHISAGGG